MRLDFCISRVVLTATLANSEKRKELSQKDRRLIFLACEVLRDHLTITTLHGKEKQLKNLIVKLTNIRKVKQASCANRVCLALNNFFKSIANALHLRIGIHQLDKKLTQVFEQDLVKNDLFPSFWEMILNLKRSAPVLKITPDEQDHILKTIISFYLISIHRSTVMEMQKKPDYMIVLDGASPLVFMQNKTGLSLGKIDDQAIQLFKQAPEMLVQKYKESKASNQLSEFFKQAFINGKDFYSLHKNLQNFNVKNDDQLVEPLKEPEKVINNDIVEPILDKEATLWKLGTAFLEEKMEEYAFLKNLELNIETKNLIIESAPFYKVLANQINFEKYLRDSHIIGKVCSDGTITEEIFPKLLMNVSQAMNFAEAIEKVEDEKKPEVEQNLKVPNPVQNDPLKFPQMNPKKAAPLQRFIDPGDEMLLPIAKLNLREVKRPEIIKGRRYKYNHDGDFINQVIQKRPIPPALANKPEAEKNKDENVHEADPNPVALNNNPAKEEEKNIEAFDFNKLNIEQAVFYLKEMLECSKGHYNKGPVHLLINAVQALVINKNEVIEKVKSNPKGNLEVIYDLIKLKIHPEHPLEETLAVIENAPRVLIEAYMEAKNRKELEVFFQKHFDFSHGCLEGCIELVQEYLFKINALKNPKQALEAPLIPDVKKDMSMWDNTVEFLKVFKDLQARKFVENEGKNLGFVLDVKWLEAGGTKDKIYERMDFEQKYSNEKAFKDFLINEAKIIGKLTNEGYFNDIAVEKNVILCTRYNLF